ncbi:MAG: hypothetical protein JWM82_1015 [Myxococcales bacterium]|nr:hypothetical protein [Myxococcales bacterium]
MTNGLGLKIEILASSDVRRALTPQGDLRGDIAFQNDVNALLARVEQMSVPWRALSDGTPSPPPQRVVADATPLPRLVGVMGLPTPARTRTLDRIGLAPLVVAKTQRVTAGRRAGRS